MALQLKTSRGRPFRLIASSSAIIIGVSFIILRTFPHLKTSLYDYLTKKQDILKDFNEEKTVSAAQENEEEVEKVEFDGEINHNSIVSSTPEESLVDISKLSDPNIKKWLNQVCILNGRSRTDTNCASKKVVVHPFLMTMALLPLMSLLKKRIYDLYNIILNLNFTQLLLSLIFSIQSRLLHKV